MLKQGWKQDSATLERPAGTLVFRKKEGVVTVVYVDTGLDDANVTISAVAADLEPAGAE